MKKLVVKTVCVTLACVFGLAVAIFGVLALFFPKSLAKSFDKLGYYNGTVFFYEKQYEKTESANDLFVLCLKTDSEKDCLKAKKYLNKFLSLPEFEEYCSKLDNGVSDNLSTEEFLESKYVFAVYLTDGVEKAVSCAQNSVKDEYTEYNPFFMLLTDSRVNLSRTDLELVKRGIEDILSDISNKTFAERDIEIINGLLG